jgi:transposase
MRYELTEYEWTAIKPMLPNKPRGVPRVNDRRVLNGILWVLRSGAPWRDLPESYGPPTTCYNRFVRWRQAGVWDRLMNALAAGHDAAVQMIDTSVVRVHQHGASIAGNAEQHSRLGVDGTRGHDDIDLEPDKFLRKFAHPLRLALRPSVLDDDVPALYVAQVAEPLAESFKGIQKCVWTVPQKTDPVDLACLLRLRRERPSRRSAAEKGDREG